MNKKIAVLISGMLILVSGLANAQQVSKIEKEKQVQELQKQKEEEMALKAIELKKQAREEALNAEDIRNAMEEARQSYAIGRSTGNVYVSAPDGGFQSFYVGDQNSSSIEYSRRLEESTSTSDFDFDIEKTARRASISVSGSCDEGEITISIMMPGGKEYTKVLIDRFGSVNWNKTFTLGDENADKTGKWKFKVTTKEATGMYRVSIRSN
jgi:hypothetical protein